tara:strand:- start:1330 stop:1905 length:576 start_codon:yes stop_codon:yes gene_type:complete
MERNLLLKNKRGISEILSYAILIIIAIAISILVFNFLRGYTPIEKDGCTDDRTLILQDYSCKYSISGGIDSTDVLLDLTLLNKGLFAVDAAYIRFGEAEKIKFLINEDRVRADIGVGGLNPGESIEATKLFNFGEKGINTIDITDSSIQIELEVQSGINTGPRGNEISLCENSISNQVITCEEDDIAAFSS